MRIFHKIPHLNKNTVVALGFFDGIHLGHQKVISDMLNSNLGAHTVFSFEFDDENITKSDFSYLISSGLKEKLLNDMGIENFISPSFSDIKDITADEFLNSVLKKSLKAKAIFCGEDYRFGKNAEGDIIKLKSFCEKNDIRLNVVSSITLNGEKVSSTYIRNVLKNGDVSLANKLLGRNFQIDFPVSNGRKIGRTLGYPTINQIFPKNFSHLKFGVYLTKIDINDRCYYGITNFGVKPTVMETSSPSAETTIFNFNGDLYGKKVKLSFIEFIREEKKFNSLDDLKEQILKDVTYAKEIINDIETTSQK